MLREVIYQFGEWAQSWNYADILCVIVILSSVLYFIGRAL